MPRKTIQSRLTRKLRGYFQRAKNRIAVGYQKVSSTFRRRPLVSFFVTLGLLLLLIIVGNFLSTPKSQNTQKPLVKQVNVYHIGSVPKVSLPAKIEKSGVIK